MIKADPIINNSSLLNIQYRIHEIPLKNLQGWKHYVSYRQQSKELIENVSRGLLSYQPELLTSGEGGAYLLRSEDGSLLAVFKPFDEDPFSLRNPKFPKKSVLSMSTFPLRPPANPPVRPGETAHKEVAAYLLDHHRLAGVPLTTLVRLFGVERWGPEGKVGSLQSYVRHDHDSWELSPSLYSKYDVHCIALLDIRLINTDRHGGNILVRRNSDNSSGEELGYKLVPIDHGFCLPDSLEGEDLWFEWMSWPQSKLRFDSRLRKYIREMDLEEDSALLRGLGLGEESIRTMLFCSILLQQGVIKGMSPLQITEVLCRRPITNFIPENGDHETVMKAMRYRIEEMLEQIGAPHSPPLCRVPNCLDPLEDLRLRHRRQNSAPHLAGPLSKISSSLGAY